MSLFSSIAELVRSLAEMGINSSGVRQIAAAAGTGDDRRVARTATVLRRISVVLGVLGGVLVVLCARQLAEVTFGSDERAASVAMLSVAVFFGCVAGGQQALVQGMRRIGDLAKLGVFGALLGSVISIALVYLLGERGVALAVVALAASLCLSAWWYGRKVRVEAPKMSAAEVGSEASGLLRLGFAFMASALMMTATAYVVRLILIREVALEAAGLYQAAWTLGGLYVGFILQAMGADFYPRLTGIASDNVASNRLVNEQAAVSLLLAGPGIIATLTFASLVVGLFYSAEFAGAVGILRWICLGMALRIVIWPIGYIILAKGEQRIFFWTELAWTAVHITLAWICVKYWGVEGAGIAFFASYVFHGVLIYCIVQRLSGFRWAPGNVKTGLLFCAMIAAVFGFFTFVSVLWATAFGIVALAVSVIYTARSLLKVVAPEDLPRPLRQLFARVDSWRG
jgi:PST family polysaccharide transporter